MVWSLLTIAIGVYAGLCLVFFLFQRSFIYMPTPVTAAHAAAFPLEVPGATVRISARPHDGPKALVYFGGNAEDVSFTAPELAELFPDRAIYGMHYRGYSGSSGRPAEPALRSDARALFALVPLADTRRLVAAFPPGVATLKVVDGTDHNSVSAEAAIR